VRVLVVDDEVDMQELMLAILEQYGAEVRVAASAAEALLLDAFQPDIFISDIGMPGVDGYMLMRQIRQRSRLPPMPESMTNNKHSPLDFRIILPSLSNQKS